MAVPLLEAYQDWHCPACGKEERTRPQPPNSARMHDCPRLHGLTAPMARAGTDCTLVAVERGDYLRKEHQRTGDDGKPYMTVQTIHADGRTDAVVFPGVAYVSLSAR